MLVSNQVISRSARLVRLCTTAVTHARYALGFGLVIRLHSWSSCVSSFVEVLGFCIMQKSEWKLHRLECEALSKLYKERRMAVTPSIRLMIKLYLRTKLQTERVKIFLFTQKDSIFNFGYKTLTLLDFSFRSFLLLPWTTTSWWRR